MNAEATRLLECARRETDPVWRKLCVVAAITRALAAQNIRPVVIGGTAVAFYTLGGYATEDVDLAVVGRAQFAEAMAGLGFVRQGRLWQHPDFDFPVEAPADALPGEDAPRTTLSVNGVEISILGIEDLIIDRLNALVHWRSASDGDWVLALLQAHGSTVDWAYLARKADEHQTAAALAGIRERLQHD
jgi:predicted nucleotidyltransferase